MAGWNDLPTELKERIVDLIDDEKFVSKGTATTDSTEQQTLVALSGVNRELYELVGPILWRTLKLKSLSLGRLQHFASNIAPRRAGHIQQIEIEGSFNSADDIEKGAALCAEAFSRAPKVQHLYMRTCSAFVSKLLPLLSDSWRQGIHLSALEYLEMFCVEGFDDPTLSGEWSGPLIDLELEPDDPVALPHLFTMLDRVNSTLRKLETPLLKSSHPFPDPPLHLPHLRTLKLTLNARTASVVSAFSASPLQSPTVALVVDTKDVRIAGTKTFEVVKACKETLRNVLVEIKVTGLDLAGERPMTQIYEFCEEEGIEVKIDWQGGDSEEEEEEDRF
ncbi:hypothetical protein BCR35DRAFT_333846 [Leucosporidium creatinivorum]|uniref:F-box domain-containing protein n=1 Tax=Leucosporidium creatinivorum TaxID=106004 RepID=A0A1Y2EMT4_9BASI|nr:hypothetical protein BCR35DRAFT_333846 [Leucosporidium creatinivorum]